MVIKKLNIYLNRFIKILLIFILVILLIIRNFKNNTEKFFNNKNLSNYERFCNDLGKYKKKKKYVLIFTGGPTLKEFKKENFKKDIYKDSYIIAVKNSINYLDKIGLKPDFLITNYCESALRININLIKKLNTINIAYDYEEDKNNLKVKKLKKYFNYLIKPINPEKKNLMKLVNEDKKGLDFENINNNIFSGWGHIMMEVAIPFCIFLETENIVTIGWDNNITSKINNKYWDTIENFSVVQNGIDWSSNDTIVNVFSSKLPKYLKKHYNINIFKLNENSGMKLPLFK